MFENNKIVVGQWFTPIVEKLLRAGEWLGLSSEIDKVIKLAKDLV